MIDARLLFDVHFQQGKRPKEALAAQSHPEEHPKATPAPPSEGWHSEEEQLGSSEHKKDAGTLH